MRSVGKTQTFLSAAEVDELTALYEQGTTLAQLGERFGVYHRTVAAHLVRRSAPIRVQGLAEEHTSEAVRLYEGGMTLMEVGLHFGVSQGAVKEGGGRSRCDHPPSGTSGAGYSVKSSSECSASYSAIANMMPSSGAAGRLTRPCPTT